MRIRKHFFSLSASITAPIHPSPPLDLSHDGDHHNHGQSLPVVQLQEQVHPNDNKLSDPSSKTKELESEKKKETINIGVTGKKEISILCAETSSHDNGLFEGNKVVIPTKKRRGSIGKRVNHNDDFEEYYKEGIITKSSNLKKKMKKNEKSRGNVIMEGSRCSRVNGRGWRCGQQTIVGYSLCEHHLGKGRLRSMITRTAVRGHSQKKNAPKVEVKTTEMQGKEIERMSIDDNELEDDDDDDDVKEELELISSPGKKKKKQQLGMVKERSLSSLLSQIDS